MDNSTASIWRELARGALRGAIATVPMSATMALMPRGRPALPPTRAGKRLSRRLGLRETLESPSRVALGALAHIGIGAAGGVCHALLRRLPWRRSPSRFRRYAEGITLAGGIWSFGYTVLLPALGLVERPRHTPRRQLLTMWVAHGVFGATLAALEPTI